MARMIWIAAVLTLFVVGLGAYVRLSDAGLGCPDWPGCYGQLGAPSSAEQHRAAQAAFPDSPVETAKAWKEMVHRYAAGTLGLLILAIFVRAWREKSTVLGLSAVLLGLVAFQALLGRWTVTELLRPAIVSMHLMGGMATLALLAWMGLAQARSRQWGIDGLRIFSALGLAAVVAQIALGGWTSSHYAALACGDGLTCRGAWIPEMDFAGAFFSRIAATPEALTAIHWSHRVGAVVVVALLLPLGMSLLRKGVIRLGGLILALLTLQVSLGIANVALGLPLAVGVLHNAVAASLLVAMVALNWRLSETGKNEAE